MILSPSRIGIGLLMRSPFRYVPFLLSASRTTRPPVAPTVEKSAVATFQVGEQPGVAFNAQLGVAGRDDFRGVTMHADRCIRLAAKTHRRAAGFRDRLTRGCRGCHLEVRHRSTSLRTS